MTYNMFGGTLNLAQSINHVGYLCLEQQCIYLSPTRSI